MTDIDETITPADDESRGRRDFLGKAAIAAAVSAVAGLSMSKTVDASTGDAVLVGLTTTAGATTTISGGTTLRVVDGSSTGPSGGTSPRVGSIYGSQSANSRAGVMGETTGTSGGWAVYGRNSSSSGIGVYGLNVGSGGVGVYGEHAAGSTESGSGVVGVSNTAVGVSGSGATYDFQGSGSGRVLLSAAGVANPPTSGTVGTIARDSTGNMWICVATNTWRKIAGTGTSGSLHLLATPKRVYDSRPGEAPLIGTKTPLTNLASRTVDCTANTSGVPTNARGVVLNVTVVTITSGGFLAVTPGGAGFTGTSTLNWTAAGAIVANGVTVGCGTGATIDVTTGGGGSANVLVDVFGYYL